MIAAEVSTVREPSAAAWERSGEIAARILRNLAERDLAAQVAAHNQETDLEGVAA